MEQRGKDKPEDCHKQGWMHRIGHGWMMAICCLLPIGAAFAVQAAGYGSAAGYMMLLLCPVMHLFMMKGMMHKKKTETDSVRLEKSKGRDVEDSVKLLWEFSGQGILM